MCVFCVSLNFKGLWIIKFKWFKIAYGYKSWDTSVCKCYIKVGMQSIVDWYRVTQIPFQTIVLELEGCIWSTSNPNMH